MCVYESLRAAGEWKGLHDRTQKLLELDEYDSVNNVDGENEGNQNTMENDFETRHHVDVGALVGALVDALVFPQPQCQLRGSWIEVGDGVGASHETQGARRTESSSQSTVVLGRPLMRRCGVLQPGSVQPEGKAGQDGLSSVMEREREKDMRFFVIPVCDYETLDILAHILSGGSPPLLVEQENHQHPGEQETYQHPGEQEKHQHPGDQGQNPGEQGQTPGDQGQNQDLAEPQEIGRAGYGYPSR